ncbi:MAG: kynureninase [Bacillota bacterium]
MKKFKAGEGFALEMDAKDPLKDYTQRFYKKEGQIYMDGNSLGLLSKDAEASLLRILEEWKILGINGWLEGDIPWFYYGEELGKMMAPLVGAQADEVIITGSTTVNLHNLTATFFRPNGKKNKILADELNFPSDKYALDSQLRLHNLNSDSHLILVRSRDGKTLDEDDIVAAMNENVALIILPAVLYRSGQLLDIEYLTSKAHEKGILIGFDCSHSVGAVPHKFSQWEVDFAFWCNYKYMNNGPGGTAGIYVNKKHFNIDVGLAGWWGYQKDSQFDMKLDFRRAKAAGGWQIGTINMLSTAPLEGSLKIYHEAGIENLREKSMTATEYLIFLMDELLPLEKYGFQIGTPRNPQRRGGHVAVEHEEALRINEALKKRGVIPDFRYPNVIRLAPVPLYVSFHEIWQVVQHLKEIMDNQEYANFSDKSGPVA